MVETHLSRLLNSSEFVVTAEVTPPHGSDKEQLLSKLAILKDFCDAVNVTDNVRGIPSLSSMACCHLLIDSGVEPIMQLSSRDRNRIAFESEIYGASALGVKNIIFVTGDHSLLGSHPHAKMVYDFDSIQALQIATHLMGGHDLAGAPLDGVPDLYLGSTFNPNADPMEMHAWRVEKKIEAGAQFFQTQAIYDVGRFKEFMRLIDKRTKVLAGIIPLRGPAMAEFMTRNIPGILIPDDIIKRLEKAGEGLEESERQKAVKSEGLQIAIETIREIRKMNGVNGIHIMGVGWEECVPLLVEDAGLYPRPGRE